MRLADYIMQRLHLEGVRHIFQVTGRGSLFLNDAVARTEGIKAVSLHHEQSCAFAAVAHADRSGNLGACLVSTGCASTNALTGVLTAWQDGIPCVFISGQNILKETTRHTGLKLRTFGQQEADIIDMVSSITKYSKMVENPEEIETIMDEALLAANSGRKGPVWLDVPLDVQSAAVDFQVRRFVSTQDAVLPNGLVDHWTELTEILKESERPAILIGSGVRSAGVEREVHDFIERLGVPLVYTSSAPDIVGSHHAHSIGSVGAMGCSRAGNFTIQNADLVLILGSRMSSLTTGPEATKFARMAKTVVVDIDPNEHRKDGIRIDKLIACDLRTFFDSQPAELGYTAPVRWLEQCQHWKSLFAPVESDFSGSDEIDLYQLAEVLSQALTAGSTLVTDSGLIEVILPTNISFGRDVRCVHPVSQGAMGFALPAAIGAQYAADGPVLAVIGDGSIMMNLQELESIRYQQLPIKILVVNNNAYSIIRRRQKELFRGRSIGTDPSNGVSCPSFEQVATCFGLDYMLIDKVPQLPRGIETLMKHERPVICEVMGKTDQSYIELGFARSAESNRFVRRPLEDQAPFLPRELFLREMIVPPIDQ